jgi:formylglycine-generating enzyme required for sulfatase activity
MALAAIACSDRSAARIDAEFRGREYYAATVEQLTHRLREHPTDVSVLRALAKAQWSLGHFDDAQNALQRALPLDKTHETALTLLDLLNLRGRYVEAAEFARKLVTSGEDGWVKDLDAELQRLRSAAGEGRAGDLQRDGEHWRNTMGMSFVTIPGGIFTRGVEDGDRDHRPARPIELSPYYIGAHEVTFGLYRLYLDTVVDTHTEITLADTDRPVAGISWLEARQFAIWLSFREQAVYRLPTEAEWEFAARGREGYREPWGNERGRKQEDANWGQSPRRSTPPLSRIGTYARDRSPFGVFDMAGNVAEWCLDEYDETYYAWSPARNPYGALKMNELKVLRGGSWNHPGPGNFAIIRSKARADQVYTGYGFRLVREEGRPDTGWIKLARSS